MFKELFRQPMPFKIYCLNRKRVEIIQRFSHTTLVKFIKDGKTMSVRSDYIKTYTIKDKPQKQQIINNNQLKLDL